MAIGDTFEELFGGPLPNSSYLDRLSDASFVSPSGVEFAFKFDEVSREGSKKLSISEILDSDQSLLQDQGNKAIMYPMSIYFTGKDYDLIADQFFIALSEKYSVDKTGKLNHPRWGQILVSPVTWKQSENFVSGSGFARFDVPFVRVYPGDAPFSQEASLAGTQTIADKMKAATEDIFDNVLLDSVRDASNFAGRIANSFGLVNGVISGLVSSQQELLDEIEKISDGFNFLIDDVADNAYILMFQTQKMMDLPSNLRDDTQLRVNRFQDLFNLLITGNQNDDAQNENVQKNNVVLLESLAGYANAQMVVSASNTTYATRNQILDSILNIITTYNTFNDELNNNSTNDYPGDHNFLSNLADLNKKTVELLLNISFDLPAEKIIVLKNADDPINLCYKYYGKIDLETIQFFADTNYLVNDEFIELAAGREIVIYG